MKLSPYFEVNGQRYEIRRSRFLMCELEKIRESSDVEKNIGQEVIQAQKKVNRLNALNRRVDELYDKYLETFLDEDKARWEKAQAEYDKLFEEVMPLLEKGGVLERVDKVGVDNTEKLVIVALQHNEKGEVIRKKEEAEEIWCSWVDEAGQVVAQKWLNAFANHIMGYDESEEYNSFLAQAKARAEQKAENQKAGLAKIKK